MSKYCLNFVFNLLIHISLKVHNIFSINIVILLNAHLNCPNLLTLKAIFRQTLQVIYYMYVI